MSAARELVHARQRAIARGDKALGREIYHQLLGMGLRPEDIHAADAEAGGNVELAVPEGAAAPRKRRKRTPRPEVEGEIEVAVEAEADQPAPDGDAVPGETAAEGLTLTGEGRGPAGDAIVIDEAAAEDAV